ncbi:hypothetical protein LPJ66_010077 [Kickxella alabastrina]|uniref:Uncharacterized protein n=1 Tax=Kickxella alabastrina TaxID=61397 RepID=A0ACC1I280_9FUNG|nr:hypothetical protein LPJ66_010077 [Kickxella alabastrina]
MPQGAGNSGNVVHRASRKSNESSNGFEEAATFTVASPDPATTHINSYPPKPKQVTLLQSPLHAQSHHMRQRAKASADTAAIDIGAGRRPGPLRRLPTELYLGEGASSGRPMREPSGSSDGAAEKPMALAPGDSLLVATPPAEGSDQWYRDQIDYVRTQVEQMESQDTQRGQEAQSIRSKWKRELFLLFEDPSSSPSAFVINVFVTFMIIFSAVLTTIETIPALRKGNSQMWLALELIIVAVFTLEFVLRFLGHTDSWRQAWDHTKSFVTVVDALAIFPFYLEMAFQRDTSYEFRFTILRIFRLLRVFSAFKYSSLLQLSIEVMIVAIKRSSDALLAFLLFVTLTVLLFSALMYFAERGTWDDARQAFLTADGEYSKFSSIPAAAYYSIVTLTTTGFGDMVPTTIIGKLVSFPMMIAGILLIALPSIIVGRNFTQVWEAARRFRAQRARVRGQLGIGAGVEDEGEEPEARGSGRTSRRSRVRRTRRAPTCAGAAAGSGRRDGSVSSFESRSPRVAARSPMEKPGGYTFVYSGQLSSSNDYARSPDPFDALARKDSIEMQEIADGHSDEEEGADGAAGRTGAENASGDENGSSSGHSSGSRSRWSTSWRKGRGTGTGKGKGRAPEGRLGVSRLEWEAMHAEMGLLRAAVAGNETVLRAIAAHLATPLQPATPPPPHRN